VAVLRRHQVAAAELVGGHVGEGPRREPVAAGCVAVVFEDEDRVAAEDALAEVVLRRRGVVAAVGAGPGGEGGRRGEGEGGRCC